MQRCRSGGAQQAARQRPRRQPITRIYGPDEHGGELRWLVPVQTPRGDTKD